MLGPATATSTGRMSTATCSCPRSSSNRPLRRQQQHLLNHHHQQQQRHHQQPRQLEAAAARAAAPSQHQPPLPPPETINLLGVEAHHGVWHAGVHFVASEVRDYELDQFSVVNNAVYASYVQHGRHKALQSLGLAVGELQAAGTLLALSQLSLQYKAPLRAGDVFFITTTPAQVTPARLVIEHTVQQFTGHQGSGEAPLVVCTAQATVVFLSADYKPVRMPQHVRELLAAKHAELGRV